MISTKSEKKERLEAFSRLKKVSALHPFYRAPTKKFANYKVVLRQPGGYRLPQSCRGGQRTQQSNKQGQTKTASAYTGRCADAGKKPYITAAR